MVNHINGMSSKKNSFPIGFLILKIKNIYSWIDKKI